MGVLAHFLEDEGLATTQISLIREHTEIIKPPRALWVPFELGRPLGAPDDPVFQTKVLLKALKLLEAPAGPVLEDFLEDAPASKGPTGPLACPVSFHSTEREINDADRRLAALKEEILQLRNWYDLAVAKRSRTTACVTNLQPEASAEFMADFVKDPDVASPIPGIEPAMAFKLASEDLKAFYLEAVTAMPGQPTDSDSLSDWFWGQTVAAKMINAAREKCLASGKSELKIFGELLLIPRKQMHRFKS